MRTSFGWAIWPERSIPNFVIGTKKDKDHASINVLNEIQGSKFQSRGLTPFAQAMPDQYKVSGDAVTAYRAFYLGEKKHFRHLDSQATARVVEH